MKVGEVLKIFGYIFVLLLCFALMQGLSTFEYNLREDKSITYELSWSEDFGSASESNRWTLRGDNIQFNEQQLILELTSDGMAQIAILQFPEIIDSGYVEIKVIVPEVASPAKPSYALRHPSGKELPLVRTKSEATTQEWRSPVLAGKDLGSIVLTLAAGQSLDSIADYQAQSMIVNSIQFMKQVHPKKLF
jgi:hypothetical protein